MLNPIMQFIELFLNIFSKPNSQKKPDIVEKPTEIKIPSVPIVIDTPEAPVIPVEAPIDIEIDDSWLIPVGVPGQAVSSAGWTYTGGKPNSVTWHWTATWDRDLCDKLLGGSNAMRKPVWNDEKAKWEGGASVHYCIGRSYSEGISQYVKLEHRSWHAGAGQTVRWDGQKINSDGRWLSGARTSIGIETVEVGWARNRVPEGENWIEVYGTAGKFRMKIQPWTEEQIKMMIFLGKKIQKKFPHLKYIDHHGHMDICPGHKEDPSLAFPFAEVLSGIYDVNIPDVWSPFMLIEPRQRALELLGYNLGPSGVDGDWGRMSDAALIQFQKDHNLYDNGHWSTFVCWEIYFSLLDNGFVLDDIKVIT